MCLSIYIMVEVFEAKKYVAYEIFFFCWCLSGVCVILAYESLLDLDVLQLLCFIKTWLSFQYSNMTLKRLGLILTGAKYPYNPIH